MPSLNRNAWKIRVPKHLCGAIFAVALGVIFAVAGPRLSVWGSEENYVVVHVLSASFLSFIREVFLFCVGTYLGSLAFWRPGEDGKLFLPWLVPLGSLLIAFLGSLFSGLIMALADPALQFLFGTSPEFGISLAFSFSGAVLGATLVMNLEFGHPAWLKRPLEALVGFAFFGIFPFLTITGNDFPISKGIHERHEWACKNFGKHYLEASRIVQNSSVILEDAGRPLESAPKVGDVNNVLYGPGESFGNFAIEVSGPLGTGVCRLGIMLPYSAAPGTSPTFVYSGISWERRGERVPLKNDGSLDVDSLKTEERLRAQDRFLKKLQDLYQGNQFAEVVQEYTSELKRAGGISHSREMVILLAESHEKLGNASQASSFYDLAAFLEGGDSPARKRLAEKALELNPANPSALKLLKEFSNQQGQDKKDR